MTALTYFLCKSRRISVPEEHTSSNKQTKSPQRQEGGGRGVQDAGDTCTPVADSCWCVVQTSQYCKVIILQLRLINYLENVYVSVSARIFSSLRNSRLDPSPAGSLPATPLPLSSSGFLFLTLANCVFSAQLKSYVFVVFQSPSCIRLCDPMDLSTPGLPVHHSFLEFAQAHVHRIGDAIQPSHPLMPFSPSALNLSQHQGLFQWVICSHQMTKYMCVCIETFLYFNFIDNSCCLVDCVTPKGMSKS